MVPSQNKTLLAVVIGAGACCGFPVFCFLAVVMFSLYASRNVGIDLTPPTSNYSSTQDPKPSPSTLAQIKQTKKNVHVLGKSYVPPPVRHTPVSIRPESCDEEKQLYIYEQSKTGETLEAASSKVANALDDMSTVFSGDRTKRARMVLYFCNKLEDYGKPETASRAIEILCQAVPKNMHRHMRLDETGAAILTLVHGDDQ